MARKDIKKDGKRTRFKKGTSGNPKGRPKKIETVIKELFSKEYNFQLSKSQISEIMIGVLSKTRSELVEMANNDQLPFWISLIAKKAQEDYKKGSIDIIEKMFDRVYGKSKQPLEHTGKDGEPIKTTIEGFTLNGEFIAF